MRVQCGVGLQVLAWRDKREAGSACLSVCLSDCSVCSLQMPLDAYVLLACSNDIPQRPSRAKSFRGFMPHTVSVVVDIRLQLG